MSSAEEHTPVRIHVTNIDELARRLAQPRRRRKRRGISLRSFTLVSGADAVQEILPQSDSRCEAWIIAASGPFLLGGSKADVLPGAGNQAALVTAAGPNGSASAAAANTVTNPAGGATIASITGAALAAIAPPGTLWLVSWTASLQGTVAAGDANNMKLNSPFLTTIEAAIFPGVVGDYPQLPVQIVEPAGQGIFVLTFNAASGASAIYGAQITAVPLLPSFVPVPLFTTDGVWAGAPLLPVTLAVLAVYEQPE